jgi:hypothetical protein
MNITLIVFFIEFFGQPNVRRQAEHPRRSQVDGKRGANPAGTAFFLPSAMPEWPLLCSFPRVTSDTTMKCAKMEQSMEIRSPARIKPGLNEFSTLALGSSADELLGPNRRVAERLNHLKQLGIENNRRQVSQIEAMIADFDRSANELERWIQDEQNRTRIHDPAHPAYSTFAQATVQRRDKLKLSIDALKRQLAEVASTAGQNARRE